MCCSDDKSVGHHDEASSTLAFSGCRNIYVEELRAINTRRYAIKVAQRMSRCNPSTEIDTEDACCCGQRLWTRDDWRDLRRKRQPVRGVERRLRMRSKIRNVKGYFYRSSRNRVAYKWITGERGKHKVKWQQRQLRITMLVLPFEMVIGKEFMPPLCPETLTL